MELTVDALACRRAGRLVFEGAAFRLAAGEAAVLRGPNGSGKSSLIRVLCGLSPPEGGSARLGDLRLSDGEAWRESIALAGHLDAVKPAMTVRENLAFWAGLNGAGVRGARAHGAGAHGAGTRVDAALDRFGLAALADDPAAWCSAGQRRRLGLARLLVVDRPLWLLDEPTVSLDARSVEAFAATVAEHCAAGGLALAATHVDLGLPPGPAIEMGDFAPAARETAQADPFLGAGWA